ncbi:MAG: OmpA family protein [Candidatus Symbiothrix sp.]|jgi:outer membrane protein OmpA-like peptidoglycan-associated protein|nr:OmpA family protein [Candidatus Symbiothrix sp.]
MKKKKIISNVFYRSSLLLIVVLLSTNTSCGQTDEPSSDMSEWYFAIDGQTKSATDSLLAEQYLKTSYFPYEISVWGAGGISRLHYNTGVGNANSGAGNAFGIGYTNFFNPYWGWSLGAEYAVYQRSVTVNGLNDSYRTCDILGNKIIYHSHLDNYREQQRLGMVNIPLSLLYQRGYNTKFYASVGMKLGLPIYGYYKSNPSVLTTAGYYPDYDQLEIWQNDLGYGGFSMQGSKTNLNFGVSFMGTMETGVKWSVGVGKDLYTGIYMDYGFNNVLKDNYSGNRLVEYSTENPASPVMHGVLTSQYPIDKVSPLAIGLKVKFGFSVGTNNWLSARKKIKSRQFSETDIEANSYEPVLPKEEMPVQNDEPIQPTVVTDVQDILIESSDCNCEKASVEQIQKDIASMKAMTNYDLGLVSVTVEQQSTLDQYVELLQANPQINVEIIGHTCDTGSDAVNLRVGQQRADFAKDYLVKQGISPDRLHTSSKGESEPAFPNTSKENRKKNRRLEIKIMEQ